MGISWLLNPHSGTAIANENGASSREKHILVIHSYNLEISWTQSEKDGIDQGFQDSDQDITHGIS
ncbi:MAG: hypothetical protein AAGL17_19655 [Cyanobacteria bacterium J06576_12]